MTTNVITVTPATYARAAMTRLAGQWWWVIVVPMALFVIASLWNTAYLFAALIWLLMLMPPALMIAYYSYLLKPQAAAMSRPHRVTIAPDGMLTVTFEAPDNDDDTETFSRHADITLSGKNLYAITEKSDHIELNYRGAPLDLLIIPFISIPTPQASHAIAHLHSARS